MSRTTIAVVIAAVIVLAGCGPTQGSSPAPSPSPSLSANFVPKPQVSSDFVNRLDGSTATIPLGSAVMTALTGSDEGMLFNKTDVAYENLIKGDKDLILVTYPSDEEFQMAADAGVELDVIPVVKDALVFLANTGNTVDNLTQDQVKDIYTGTTTNWSQLGGADAAIIPYQRQVNSGSQTLFLKLAMGDVTPMDAPTDMRPDQMDRLVDVISDYDDSVNAIGYTMFYYVTQMYMKDTVKLLSIDGIQPSAQTISDESFPYLTYYYAVVRKDSPADSDARKVIEWMLGDEAQQLASQTNYVPMDPRNIQPVQPVYGYYGSTQENTTQSSGTGGTQPKTLTLSSCYNQDPSPLECAYDAIGQLVSISYPGQDAMSQVIADWFATYSYVSVEAASDFIQLSATDSQDNNVQAIISSSGDPLPLSYFFYDSVNYIAYINQNLFNESTNPLYADWLAQVQIYPELGPVEHDPPGGFTGIPNDYPEYSVSPFSYNGQFVITFTFPDGNPFFTAGDTAQLDGSTTPSGSNETRIGLGIPVDLSPYGRIVSDRWTQNSSGQVYPVIVTTSTPSSSDATLNGKITSAVQAHPEMGCFDAGISDERISLVAYPSQNPCKDPYPGSTDSAFFPTLVGQWAFGTWDDDPMTEGDLPSTWRTDTGGWGATCPVDDLSHCSWPDAAPVLSPNATVRSVWADPYIEAIIVDGGSMYEMQYG